MADCLAGCSPTAVMQWLGLISYGIFLWHLAIAAELGAEWGWLPTLLGTLVLSVAVAAASYYLVERPILRLKYHRLADLIGRRQGPKTRPPRPGLRWPGCPSAARSPTSTWTPSTSRSSSCAGPSCAASR